ncbi:MAG TPA: hydrogenase maturation protease [Verrucomicrobiae bacterium]|nr:hydrogenase maturation protease [Verrucomicrobiae bacterium]
MPEKYPSIHEGTRMKILVAGIGNIFYGDDAFGCEVARELKRVKLPENVTVTDFGIRSYDLAYALTNDFDAIILVDATTRGQAPGTVYLIEPDMNHLNELDRTSVDAHSMDPVAVIQMAQSLGGGVRGKLFLVGCEPAMVENEDGALELSEKVKAAIPGAMAMIGELIRELTGGKTKSSGLAPAVTKEV